MDDKLNQFESYKERLKPLFKIFYSDIDIIDIEGDNLLINKLRELFKFNLTKDYNIRDEFYKSNAIKKIIVNNIVEIESDINGDNINIYIDKLNNKDMGNDCIDWMKSYGIISSNFQSKFIIDNIINIYPLPLGKFIMDINSIFNSSLKLDYIKLIKAFIPLLDNFFLLIFPPIYWSIFVYNFIILNLIKYDTKKLNHPYLDLIDIEDQYELFYYLTSIKDNTLYNKIMEIRFELNNYSKSNVFKDQYNFRKLIKTKIKDIMMDDLDSLLTNYDIYNDNLSSTVYKYLNDNKFDFPLDQISKTEYDRCTNDDLKKFLIESVFFEDIKNHILPYKIIKKIKKNWNNFLILDDNKKINTTDIKIEREIRDYLDLYNRGVYNIFIEKKMIMYYKLFNLSQLSDIDEFNIIMSKKDNTLTLSPSFLKKRKEVTFDFFQDFIDKIQIEKYVNDYLNNILLTDKERDEINKEEFKRLEILRNKQLETEKSKKPSLNKKANLDRQERIKNLDIPIVKFESLFEDIPKRSDVEIFFIKTFNNKLEEFKNNFIIVSSYEFTEKTTTSSQIQLSCLSQDITQSKFYNNILTILREYSFKHNLYNLYEKIEPYSKIKKVLHIENIIGPKQFYLNGNLTLIYPNNCFSIYTQQNDLCDVFIPNSDSFIHNLCNYGGFIEKQYKIVLKRHNNSEFFTFIVKEPDYLKLHILFTQGDIKPNLQMISFFLCLKIYNAYSKEDMQQLLTFLNNNNPSKELLTLFDQLTLKAIPTSHTGNEKRSSGLDYLEIHKEYIMNDNKSILLTSTIKKDLFLNMNKFFIHNKKLFRRNKNFKVSNYHFEEKSMKFAPGITIEQDTNIPLKNTEIENEKHLMDIDKGINLKEKIDLIYDFSEGFKPDLDKLSTLNENEIFNFLVQEIKTKINEMINNDNITMCIDTTAILKNKNETKTMVKKHQHFLKIQSKLLRNLIIYLNSFNDKEYLNINFNLNISINNKNTYIFSNKQNIPLNNLFTPSTTNQYLDHCYANIIYQAVDWDQSYSINDNQFNLREQTNISARLSALYSNHFESFFDIINIYSIQPKNLFFTNPYENLLILGNECKKFESSQNNYLPYHILIKPLPKNKPPKQPKNPPKRAPKTTTKENQCNNILNNLNNFNRTFTKKLNESIINSIVNEFDQKMRSLDKRLRDIYIDVYRGKNQLVHNYFLRLQDGNFPSLHSIFVNFYATYASNNETHFTAYKFMLCKYVDTVYLERVCDNVELIIEIQNKKNNSDKPVILPINYKIGNKERSIIFKLPDKGNDPFLTEFPFYDIESDIVDSFLLNKKIDTEEILQRIKERKSMVIPPSYELIGELIQKAKIELITLHEKQQNKIRLQQKIKPIIPQEKIEDLDIKIKITQDRIWLYDQENIDLDILKINENGELRSKELNKDFERLIDEFNQQNETLRNEIQRLNKLKSTNVNEEQEKKIDKKISKYREQMILDKEIILSYNEKDDQKNKLITDYKNQKNKIQNNYQTIHSMIINNESFINYNTEYLEKLDENELNSLLLLDTNHENKKDDLIKKIEKEKIQQNKIFYEKQLEELDNKYNNDKNSIIDSYKKRREKEGDKFHRESFIETIGDVERPIENKDYNQYIEQEGKVQIKRKRLLFISEEHQKLLDILASYEIAKQITNKNPIDTHNDDYDKLIDEITSIKKYIIDLLKQIIDNEYNLKLNYSQERINLILTLLGEDKFNQLIDELIEKYAEIFEMVNPNIDKLINLYKDNSINLDSEYFMEFKKKEYQIRIDKLKEIFKNNNSSSLTMNEDVLFNTPIAINNNNSSIKMRKSIIEKKQEILIIESEEKDQQPTTKKKKRKSSKGKPKEDEPEKKKKKKRKSSKGKPKEDEKKKKKRKSSKGEPKEDKKK